MSIVVVDTERLTDPGQLILRLVGTKCRRWTRSPKRSSVSEALARVESQHEKLVAQLSELEATERVLARYGTGTPRRKMASAGTPAAATKAAAPARPRGRRRATTAKSAAGKRISPSLN